MIGEQLDNFVPNRRCSQWRLSFTGCMIMTSFMFVLATWTQSKLKPHIQRSAVEPDTLGTYIYKGGILALGITGIQTTPTPMASVYSVIIICFPNCNNHSTLPYMNLDKQCSRKEGIDCMSAAVITHTSNYCTALQACLYKQEGMTTLSASKMWTGLCD